MSNLYEIRRNGWGIRSYQPRLPSGETLSRVEHMLGTSRVWVRPKSYYSYLSGRPVRYPSARIAEWVARREIRRRERKYRNQIRAERP